MLPIRALWEKHVATPFPAGWAGEEVEDIDLTLLDAATAGCISRYLQSDGTLDLGHAATLGLCLRHLTIVTRQLEGEAQEYFHRLEVIAYEVLQSIRDVEAVRATS